MQSGVACQVSELKVRLYFKVHLLAHETQVGTVSLDMLSGPMCTPISAVLRISDCDIMTSVSVDLVA
jgi:hypothetical protein